MAIKFSFDLPMDRLVLALARSKSEAAERVTAATRKAGERLRDALRQQVLAAGLGQDLAKAWRVQHFPSRAGAASLHPAALVYSKAIALHRAFESGAAVTARGGRYLAIPLPEAVRRGLDRAMVDRKGGALSGAARPRRFAQTAAAAKAVGTLRPVKLANGNMLLVADDPAAATAQRPRRVAGATRPATAAQGRSVALFLLVKQVRVKDALDFAGASKAAGADFNGLMRAALTASA